MTCPRYYDLSHIDLEMAHHVLNDVVQNITTSLNSVATDQHTVPFLTVNTSMEISTLFWKRKIEFATVCWKNKLCWKSTESNKHVLQRGPDLSQGLGKLSLFIRSQWKQAGNSSTLDIIEHSGQVRDSILWSYYQWLTLESTIALLRHQPRKGFRSIRTNKNHYDTRSGC